MAPELNSNILAALDEERDVANTRSNSYRTLKIEKRCSALVRLLPAQLGPRKTWFARIARHWVGGRPYVCVRQTSQDFGGDPKAHCPLCALEQEYAQARSQAVRDAARRIGAFPKWLIYCFVWEMIDERNRPVATPKGELYVPNEFWVTRDGYSELANMWERSLKHCSPYGFLDPVHGYDFLVSRDSRNTLKFQREDETPIIPDKSVEEILDVIDAAIANTKLPDTTPLNEDAMEEVVMKAEDFIRRSDDNGRRGRGPGDVDEEEPGEVRRSSRREDYSRDEPRRETTSRRSAEVRRQEEPSPSPRLSSRREEVSPARRETPPPTGGGEVRGRHLRDLPSDPADFDSRPAPGEEGGEDAPAAEMEEPPTITRRRALPAPPARSQGDRVEDTPDEVPPERRDPAPPVQTTAPAAAGAAPQRSLSSEMRSRVSRLGSASI
jgi:hypothetical protein